MMDFLFAALLAGFALLSCGFLVLCQRLQGGGS